MRLHTLIVGLALCATPVHAGHEPADHAAPAEHQADVVLAAPVAPSAPVDVKAAEALTVSADAALRMLADGNDRFVTRLLTRPHQDVQRNCDTFANGQHPFAAVLACADSRVPVELIFDAGIGDLFVARIAGNVADCDEIGTLEYGVEHLGINAILVLGHSKCGAVTAVVNHAHVTPNLEKLIDNILPASVAASRAFPQLSGNALVEKAIVMNVKQSMSGLVSKSPLLAERVKSGKLKIAGGVYDLHTGEINWLELDTSPSMAGASAEPEHPHAEIAPKPEGPAAQAHESPRLEEKSDSHEVEASKSGSHEPATQPAAAGVGGGKENFLVLGVMLLGAGLCSWGTMQFIRSRKDADKPESEEKPATR